jgi:hypothetical protein
MGLAYLALQGLGSQSTNMRVSANLTQGAPLGIRLSCGRPETCQCSHGRHGIRSRDSTSMRLHSGVGLDLTQLCIHVYI